jgi:hypothetical protein
MHDQTYEFTLVFSFGTIICVFALRYFFLMRQAKYRFMNDEEYRLLAQRTALAQAESTRALQELGASMAELQARMGAIETMLKEVA